MMPDRRPMDKPTAKARGLLNIRFRTSDSCPSYSGIGKNIRMEAVRAMSAKRMRMASEETTLEPKDPARDPVPMPDPMTQAKGALTCRCLLWATAPDAAPKKLWTEVMPATSFMERAPRRSAGGT